MPSGSSICISIRPQGSSAGSWMIGTPPRPAVHARRGHPVPGSRSSPSARTGRLSARRPRATPGRGRRPSRDRPEGRTPGRRPGPGCRGRSGGCGPGRLAAAGSGCSESPRHYSSITLSDAGTRGERAQSRLICSPFWGVHDMADVAFELRRGHVIRSGVSDAARANPLVAAAFWFRASNEMLCGDMCPTQTPWSRRL